MIADPLRAEATSEIGRRRPRRIGRKRKAIATRLARRRVTRARGDDHERWSGGASPPTRSPARVAGSTRSQPLAAARTAA